MANTLHKDASLVPYLTDLKMRLAVLCKEGGDGLDGCSDWIDNGKASINYFVDMINTIMVLEHHIYLYEHAVGICEDYLETYLLLKESIQQVLIDEVNSEVTKLKKKRLVEYISASLITIGEDVRYGIASGGVPPRDQFALIAERCNGTINGYLASFNMKKAKEIYEYSEQIVKDHIILQLFAVKCKQCVPDFKFEKKCVLIGHQTLSTHDCVPYICMLYPHIFVKYQDKTYKANDIFDALVMWIDFLKKENMTIQFPFESYNLKGLRETFVMSELFPRKKKCLSLI
jgi:hypothetical protein